jgi:hypothetical protein
LSPGVTQAPVLVQQPVVHDPPHEQAPCLHSCPVAHVLHGAPPVPQAPPVGLVTQASFESQQPVGQVVGPQRPPSVGASPTPISEGAVSELTSARLSVPSALTSGAGASMETSEAPSRPALPLAPSCPAPPAPSGFDASLTDPVSVPAEPPWPEAASRLSTSTGVSRPSKSAQDKEVAAVATSIHVAARSQERADLAVALGRIWGVKANIDGSRSSTGSPAPDELRRRAHLNHGFLHEPPNSLYIWASYRQGTSKG